MASGQIQRERHRWHRADSNGARAATAGTIRINDSPWRDKRANDSGSQRLTQMRWYRTSSGDRTVGVLPKSRVEKPLVPTGTLVTHTIFFLIIRSSCEPRYGIEP